MTVRPRILGVLLTESAGLDPVLLDSALTNERYDGERVGQTLVRLGLVTEEQVARALGTQLGLAYRPGPLEPSADALELVSPELCARHGVVPISARPRRITIAMHDPLDLRAIADLQFQAGRHVSPVVATRDAVTACLERFFRSDDRNDRTDAPSDQCVAEREGKPGTPGVAMAEVRTDLAALVAALPSELTTPRSEDDSVASVERDARRAPVVRLVDGIIRGAIEERASDIHIEETGSAVRVRTRIDGVLRTVVNLPPGARRAVMSRLKVMAGMDISVRRRAQDGRVTLPHAGRALILRVNTLPISTGEKAVVRILDGAAAPRHLGALGMDGNDLRRLRALLERGEGVVLAAGPTGSGKSTTLFAALSEVDRERRNVVTVEDPVEYRLSGASQVHVDRRAGLGFADALRAILRQDPDVVMVGEIRDRETAEIAMAAAVTGHLVLSTIHATDAPGAITRLLHMGVPPFLVAGGLAGVIAQRLVRGLCTTCRGLGCDSCDDGSRGRTGVYQVLTVTDGMRDEISTSGSTARLRRLAVDAGMKTFASDARRAVAEGLTAPHEISRILRSFSHPGRPCRACDQLVPHGANACPGCGASIMQTCACGAPLEPGWRYCPACIRPVRRV
ncbi:MAG: ATPase, T2SS/T4P/T4SS family [Gemmatimonadota bacterium]|nr:ATPase, T2SS/T4P/T4SS family [Gemmatimonadota bacterium]MDE3005952.1 ATPase, T2SS/T4P/T4SS family [Gemmatimonadota bacterium]MDE3012953.1 ATPase, T2SS/T4P/T4SS family [Gemmatimonadota bacterium]